MQIGRFTPYEHLAASAPTGAVAQTPIVQPALNDVKAGLMGAEEEGTIVGSIPPAPTEEARAMVDKAATVVAEMRERNRELHFSRDEETNRVVIEVRDLDGNVLKTIPPSKALDVLSGAEL